MSRFARVLTAPVKIYQLYSTARLPRCRYFPSCSAYFIEAVERRGPVAGAYLGIKRIFRCHPWASYGYDPVPEKELFANRPEKEFLANRPEKNFSPIGQKRNFSPTGQRKRTPA